MGSSGANLMTPDVSTLLDAVTIAARAAILPAGVSTVTSRPFHSTRVARVDSATGTPLAEFGDQRAQSLAAGQRGAAILRAGFVERGYILQILAGGVGAEQKFDRPGPFAQILRQRRGAGHIDFAARGVVDGAVGAHQRGEKILGFAGARVAAADADFLTQRRRIRFPAPRRARACSSGWCRDCASSVRRDRTARRRSRYR